MTNPSPTTPAAQPVAVTGDQPAPKDAAMDSAIEAAADALVGEESGYCGPGYGTCGSLHVSREHAVDLARAALAAAVPHIERAIRDRIEAELCSEMLAVNTRYIGSAVAAAGYVDGLTVAARVARGGEAAT
jgi:hypothetical protein